MASFYTKEVEEVIKELDTNIEGLSSKEAERRLQKYGYNELEEKKGKTFFQMFINQFKDFMIIILLIAIAISLLVGEVIDATIILAIVVLNALLGAIQENRANEALKALKKLSTPQAKVLRDGEVKIISSKEIVPGDIVLLEAGDFVPADGRLIEAAALKVNESSLTGESVPVEKQIDPLDSENVSLGDRINMVFAGTTIVYGRGKMIVTNTGMNTEMGKIASMMSQEEETIPLQERLNKLGKTLGIAALVICAVIFLIGYLRDTPLLEMFLTSVSLAVAAIPEGLPAIVTITLAIGVQRLAKRNAIIRKLPAVETLGSANVICTDKTGTLTLNQMTVTYVYVDRNIKRFKETNVDNRIFKLIASSALCTDARISEEGEKIGDPTEVALVAALKKLGADKLELEAKYPRIDELPFDSDRKLMTTVHKNENLLISITKGALEYLISKCTHIDENGTIRPITLDDLKDIDRANEELAKNGMRVLAITYKLIDTDDFDKGALENNLVFFGLIGMIDPPRPEAKEAIKKCDLAGITTVMITGDHKLTAEAIAKSLGILHEGEKVVTGEELEKMDFEELEKNVKKIRVYARVSPEHKVMIVKAWQKNGAIVAMTGDGVNDAPALAQADIGIAMGITGTEVAKEAADMVLADDNFATIVSAVEEGRTIYSNIRKSVRYLLSCNIAEILTVFIANLMGLGQPLLAIHLLWINLVTDSLPALALGMDPPTEDVMKSRPRKRDESIFADGLGIQVLIEGIIMSFLAVTAFLIGNKYSVVIAETMTFMTLVFSQLFHALNSRSNKESLLKIDFFSNKFLILAIGIGILLQLVLDTPFLSKIFEISVLNINQWLWVLGLSFVFVILVEIEKVFFRKFHKAEKELITQQA
ncbi:MAG TPA: calcium-translocating P-type ATPase, SERCA-type [Defluviitoga sp.]|nr:calcium-translocating P-type ATPase, SERCA-type [Defluviitoga sp.]HOP24665.1 calcium-translocating P-type ATPase, SERCA-type [Defluviitoga sp.]HPZ28832.1 calcium-translocating P-type ATPase, SERCA-type [Defluviitoga sp.]HQD63220.1 calcium-translocating P-type ATPase, SERCA-type [Defluviitoga sp.]